MATMKGMDFDAVETWGNRIQNTEVGNVATTVRRLCTEASGLNWTGTDFENFKSTQVTAVETALRNLETALNEMGSTAVRNAIAQRSTSEAS